jgi:hypothetical protein
MRLFRAALAALFFAIVPRLNAQTSLSFAGGASIAAGGLPARAGIGYNASLALTSKPPLALIGIRIEGMFTSFDVSDSAGLGAHRIVAGIANATFSPSATLVRSPYLIGGLGVYNSRTGGSSANGNNDVGFNVGAGTNLTSAVGTFVEARYHYVPSEGGPHSFAQISFGVRF